MKARDICRQYGYDQTNFEVFVRNSGFMYKDSFTGMIIDDGDIDQLLDAYEDELYRLEQEELEKKKAENEARLEAENEEKRKIKALAEMLITSGFSFDGYRIKKYSGYISGDDCVTMPRDNFWGTNKVSDNLCGALVKIRRQAIKELKEAAYNLGCNAVIGVDFDYLTMDPQHSAALNNTVTVYEPYVICVTANGNAVIIEKTGND